MLPSNKNSMEVYEKVSSWFWVVLFISAVLYLRWVLVDMHTQTARLSEERERLRSQMDDIQSENKDFYEEFRASVEETISNFKKETYSD